MVCAWRTYFNHFRRKYHNYQLSIVNYQFAQQRAKLKGTSKNSPFAIRVDLLVQQFISKSSQYTKYSGLSETFVEPKSLTQIIKKEFLEVA